MSRKLEAQMQCPGCMHAFDISLYRTVWIEYPENRRLIFEDKINRFDCPRCRTNVNSYFPFMATNVERQIAVWYEPEHDPAIDKVIAGFKKIMGANSFYAMAPRVADWVAFKATIEQLETRTIKAGLATTLSPQTRQGIAGFIRSLGRKK